MEQTNIMKTQEKHEVSGSMEQMRPGPTFEPAVDIFENDRIITLLADMPGVRVDDLKVDLRENVLTLTGPVTLPEGPGERDVVREYRSGTFFRRFALSEAIDQEKIQAKLVDGVLRLELTKVAKAVPRQIQVQTA